MSGYVFISYAREDKAYVDRLAKFLRTEGLEVWYDAQLVVGRRFDVDLRQKIEQCAAFILVMTPAANDSAWVQDEFDLAREHDRELMPILLDGKKFLGIGKIQCEYLQGGEMPSQQFLIALRGLVGEGELLFEMKAHDGHVRSVAYPANNSSMVASAGPEMCVRIWHPATGQLRRELPGATWPVSFTRHGDKIATGGPGHTVHVWNTETGELIKRVGMCITNRAGGIYDLAYSPNGRTLASGHGDGAIRIWKA
jgi:WD40 repeat protein